MKSPEQWQKYWQDLLDLENKLLKGQIGPDEYTNLVKALDGDDTTPDEYYEWASNLADGNWNQAAQQAVNDKKDKNNETKSQTDQKCTCPIHRLSQQGCPKLRGEPKCSE